MNPALVALPFWTQLLPLPAGLDAAFLNWLIAHIESHYAPRSSHEQFLAARIAQAMARLHLSALRETETPDSLWLRYESHADRQLRDAQKAWHALRAEEAATLPPQSENPPTNPPAKPAPATKPAIATSPIPTIAELFQGVSTSRSSTSATASQPHPNGNGKLTSGNGKAS